MQVYKLSDIPKMQLISTFIIKDQFLLNHKSHREKTNEKVYEHRNENMKLP